MPAYYNEINPAKAALLRQLILEGHIPAGDVDERSIVDVRPDDIRGYERCDFFAGIGGWAVAMRIAGVPDDRPLWTASCPCQGYSSSGPKTRQSDERHLWPYLARLIVECRPPEIYGEQVDEAITAGWLDDAFSDLEAQEYACAAAVLPAYASGASFEGFRLYFCAKAAGERLQGPRECLESIYKAQDYFREADTFINAFQGNALPYVCTRHNGIPRKVAEIALHGAGDAICPQITAAFIKATM